MENKKKALGKGLEQLFTNNVLDFEAVDSPEAAIEKLTEDSGIIQIQIKDIRSNPYQPRKSFNEESLKELSESIRTYGIVQPVVVKKSIKGYELVAGERRCKASEIAGLETIPAIVKDFTDDEMMEIALLENIQREDLNPLEIAHSVEMIIKKKNITQEEFAKKFGKSRSYITNLLGILKLPEEVKKMLEDKKLSYSHAKILSKLEDDVKIIFLANKIIKENISVHALEKLIAATEVEEKEDDDTYVYKENYFMYEKLMSDHFAEKVKINKNKIEIKFADEHDLIRLLNLMNVKVDED